MMQAESEALVGSILADRYRIGEVLGQGIAGTVYGVHHVTFPRAAALKVLRPQHATPDLVSRVFHGEARAAWSVTHPSLVEVFDIGALPDGTPFFLMEHLEGETLANKLAREKLSLGAAVDIAMQLLAAVAAIHARDLLLRDLRPQNILLVGRRGCRPLVKVLDFGLARLAPLEAIQQDWELRRTNRSSAAIPHYLSPERTYSAEGVEPASDLFTVGVILYEMLAGERPFSSTTWQVLVDQIRLGSALPIDTHRPDVPHDLPGFFARVLSPQPRLRPSSAKEMQDDLRAIFEGSRRPSTAIPVARPAEEPSTFTSLAPSARPVEPLALRPLDAPPASRIPPVRAPSAPVIPQLQTENETDYGDETETRRGLSFPPPRPTHESIDVVFEEARPGLSETSERTVERASPQVATMLLVGDAADDEPEEEATETMAMTPELKDEVERLMATPPAPLSSRTGRVAPPPAPPRRTRPPKR